MKIGLIGLAVMAIVMAAWLGGCARSDNPVSSDASVPVNLSAAFSSSTSGSTLMKVGGFAGVDSLQVDSAVVVLARIKFESHIDSVSVDSTGDIEDDDEEEVNIKFRGPFVVHIRDVIAVDFANNVLPAGTYNGIKMKIHRLQPGEHHEDSDEHNGHRRDTTLAYGSSIVVWGSVFKNGAWEPFTFEFDGEFEFKIKGNFFVPAATSAVNIALHFDLGLWFRNPETGALLDPTDVSDTNRHLFRRAIRKAFELGRGGHDDDDDGHPDEEEGDD